MSDAFDRAALDRAVADLQARKDAWARLPVAAKIAYLRRLHANTGAVAARWVAAAARAKGLPPDSPLVGEEWLSGPWGLLHFLDRLTTSLRAVARRRTPRLRRGTIRARPDGQLIARVFPQTAADRLLFSGVRAEVWMEPGVTAATLASTMATFYRQETPEGRVALVLGAGNIAAIPPLDALQKLIAEGQVCLLKLNPINDYLGPIFAAIFAPLIADGFVRIVDGGAATGAYLCAHAGIDEIHVTGSARTHDAIVYGPGPAGAARKRRDEPLIAKRVTSELGNASPTIVVPGPWEAADLRHQAEQIASQKFHNAGYNCIAAQVLVTPGGWPHEGALLDALRAVARAMPERTPYYPGSAARLAALVARYPRAEALGPGRTLIPGLDPARLDEPCFADELFGGVLAQTSLPGDDPADFLARAVRFCNEALHGTLGVNILIHPATMRALGPAFEDQLAALRYGCVAVNAWTGVGFLLATATWGAYPGHERRDIRSGSGVVHNALLFSRPQKSVVFAPFRPFPRSILRGEWSVLPKPPWFVTHRRAAAVGERLVAYERDHRPRRLPGLFAAALWG